MLKIDIWDRKVSWTYQIEHLTKGRPSRKLLPNPSTCYKKLLHKLYYCKQVLKQWPNQNRVEWSRRVVTFRASKDSAADEYFLAGDERWKGVRLMQAEDVGEEHSPWGSFCRPPAFLWDVSARPSLWTGGHRGSSVLVLLMLCSVLSKMRVSVLLRTVCAILRSVITHLRYVWLVLAHVSY